MKEKPPTLRQVAHQWMDEHPEYMALFEQFAAQMVAKKRRFGISALTERVRWETALQWDDSPKINNSFRAYIARELVQRNPELAEFIETRVTKAADLPARSFSKDQRVDPLTDEPIDGDETEWNL